jgi:protein-disulfide isomerase
MTPNPRAGLRGALPLLHLLAAFLVVALPACAQAPGGAATGDRTPASAAQRDSAMAAADRSRSKGADGAPLVIYEVSDFQCPFCRQWVEGTWPALDTAYLETGRARLVFMNLPLPGHAEAYTAAEAALCAGAQGRFWPMHDLIFQRQEEWSAGGGAARMREYARQIGLDEGAFRQCADENWMAPIIIGDLMQASRAGIGGTPTFVLVPSDPGSPMQQRVLSGALGFEEMRGEIEAALAEAERR